MMQAITITLPDNSCLRGLHWNPGAPIKVFAQHGWLDNANSFVPMAKFLPDQIELVALDLAGHGMSDHRPPGHWYHFVDYARDAALAVAQLGWQRYHLLGHSLGGGISCQLAASVPEAVMSLAVVEGLGLPGATLADAGTRLQAAWQGLSKLLHNTGDNKRLHKSRESARDARLLANTMLKESADLLVERGLQEVSGGFTWRTDRRLRLLSPIRYTETEILHILQQIQCPVLQVLPDPISVYIPSATLERRPAMLNDYRQVQFKGHHHLHMDDPEACAQPVFDFITDHHEP